MRSPYILHRREVTEVGLDKEIKMRLGKTFQLTKEEINVRTKSYWK